MKKLLLLTVLNIVLSSANAQTPKAVTGVQQSCKLKIGDTYAGGIVFYLDSGSECHGLVCAPYDQPQRIEWADAITLCTSLRLGNYSDWRLPSKYELNQMCMNLRRAELGGFVSEGGAGVYWSSTELNSKVAWLEDFLSCSPMSDDKNYTSSVRAVRGF